MKKETNVGADGIREYLFPEKEDSAEDVNAMFQGTVDRYKRFRKKVVQKTYEVKAKTIEAHWHLVVPLRDDMDFNAYCDAMYVISITDLGNALKAVDSLRKLGVELLEHE